MEAVPTQRCTLVGAAMHLAPLIHPPARCTAATSDCGTLDCHCSWPPASAVLLLNLPLNCLRAGRGLFADDCVIQGGG